MIKIINSSIFSYYKFVKNEIRFGDCYGCLITVDASSLTSSLMYSDDCLQLVCYFPVETVVILSWQNRWTQETIEVYKWFLPLLELDNNTKLVQNIRLKEVAKGNEICQL